MFIKKDHYENKTFVAFMMFVFVVVIFIVISDIISKIFVVILILILTCVLYNKLKKVGIYVDKTDIIIKRLGNQKRMSVKKIIAVAIVKSIYRGKYKCIDLKDSNGKQLYTILLLTDIKTQMYNYQYGDFTFMVEFKDEVVGDCVFDESFVEWLIKENPHIKIIDNRSIPVK